MADADVNIDIDEPKKAKTAKKPKTNKSASGKKSKKGALKFTINCAAPVDDEIFDIHAFENFLKAKIKLNGKTGILGDSIRIDREKSNVNVNAKTEFSKRYLKYLTKKFLKKQQLRDYIRVISSNKNTYDLRYFNIHNEEEQEEK